MADTDSFFVRLFDDPARLKKFSDFLSGFGQGVTQANVQGLSPLASLAFGFGQGGQFLQAGEREEERELDRAQIRQLRQQQIAAERRRVAAEEGLSSLIAGRTADGPTMAGRVPFAELPRSGQISALADVAPRAALTLATQPQPERFETVQLPSGVTAQRSTTSGRLSAIPQPRQAADQFEIVKLPNGTTAQRNTRTGQISAIPQPPEPSAADQKVNRLVRQGIPKRRAEMIASGAIRVFVDPVTKRAMIFNVADNTVTEPTSAETRAIEAGAVQPEGERDRPLTAFEAVQGSVGLVGAAKGALSSTAGQFLESAQFPEVARKRAILAGIRQQAIDAFAISGRPPLAEQARIQQMFPEGGVFESEVDATEALQETVLLTRQRIEQNQRDLKDPDIPNTDKVLLLTNTRKLRNLLEAIGEPPADRTEENLPTPQTQADFDALPSGTLFIDPEDGKTYRKN